MDGKANWRALLGQPEKDFPRNVRLLRTFSHPEFDGELYLQQNGSNTFQRVMVLLPKKMEGKLPAVAVPFYFPEAMVGFDPLTGEELPFYKNIEMMLHLVRRGYITASADAYHLTYRPSDRARDDFLRWRDAAEQLLIDHPRWSGMGKLTQDTELLIDLLAADERVDETRIGIAGHSLGGKMAFYAGCLDARVKVILASDFGIRWEQTNWHDIWYWGEQAGALKAAGIDHASLLGAGGKPFFLIAGHYDNDESLRMMQAAPGYEEHPEYLGFCNHATGHRPPLRALDEGYDFLDRWLK